MLDSDDESLRDSDSESLPYLSERSETNVIFFLDTISFNKFLYVSPFSHSFEMVPLQLLDLPLDILLQISGDHVPWKINYTLC